jgi:hypothetical protein
MSDVARWILYYPHPDLAQVALVAHPFSGLINDLWTLAKINEPILADLIGRARPIFYIVRSSFLYTTDGFSHIHFSRPTCLFNQVTPCSPAAELGLRGTVMMAERP